MCIEQLNDTLDHPCHIIKLDWEGNLVDVLEIPYYIGPLVISEDNTTLFSTVQNHDDPEFSYLLKFEI